MGVYTYRIKPEGFYIAFIQCFWKKKIEINTYNIIHTPTEINILLQAIREKWQPPWNEINKESYLNLYPSLEHEWWSAGAFFNLK